MIKKVFSDENIELFAVLPFDKCEVMRPDFISRRASTLRR